VKQGASVVLFELNIVMCYDK